MLTKALATWTLDDIVKRPRKIATTLVEETTELSPERYLLEVVHQSHAAVRLVDGTTTHAELTGAETVLREGARPGVFRLPQGVEELVTALLWGTDHPLEPSSGPLSLGARVLRLRRTDAAARASRREAAALEGLLGRTHELARLARGRAYRTEADLASARREAAAALEVAAQEARAVRPFDVLVTAASAPGWSVQVRTAPGSEVVTHRTKGVSLGELLVSLELPAGAQVRFTSVLSPHLDLFEDVTGSARTPRGVLQSEVGWEDAASVLARQHVS